MGINEHAPITFRAMPSPPHSASGSSIDVSSPLASEEATFIQAASQSSTAEQSIPLQRRKKTTIREEPPDSTHSRPTSETLLRRPTTLASMFRPERRIGPAPTLRESLRAIVVASWLNVLLVFIPISWALHFALPESNSKDTIVFVLAFLAIIPLASLLAFATDELSMRVGQTIAGLLNATLGNAVELIVAIIALVKCELQVVQASLVGSILSNLLLVLGMCFFAGGIKYSEQGFGASATQLNSSLLTVSVIAVLLPAAFHLSFVGTKEIQQAGILSVSHGVSIILLFIYGAYLYFQLYSHTKLYADSGADVIRSTRYEPRIKNKSKKHRLGATPGKRMKMFRRSKASMTGLPVSEPADATPTDTSNGQTLTGQTDLEAHPEEEEEETEIPQMSVWVTLALLGAVTVLVAITAEFLVDSINGLVETGSISKEFVGIILLPIVGNAAEHATAVTSSVKDKLTLSLGVAVGSSIQIALFVIPFIITLAWILGKPLTLLFDPYESISLFLAVLTVNYVVQDGKSNWLEGVILMCLYLILAVTFWFYPGSDPSGLLDSCR